jgi:hypothetical protein
VASDDLVALFTHVAQALHALRADGVVQPIEIAELTARWAPYASMRKALGIATNEDYELLVMRLVSGEGGYVFADESLQDDLRREVASPNPDLTALRTYGAARITLAREPLRRVLHLSPDQLPAPAPAAERPAPRMTAPQANPVGDPTAPAPAARITPPPVCQFCGGMLPGGRPVNFCPQCGLNVSTRRCAGCSSEIQPGWRFCVTCGRAVGAKG